MGKTEGVADNTRKKASPVLAVITVLTIVSLCILMPDISNSINAKADREMAEEMLAPAFNLEITDTDVISYWNGYVSVKEHQIYATSRDKPDYEQLYQRLVELNENSDDGEYILIINDAKYRTKEKSFGKGELIRDNATVYRNYKTDEELLREKYDEILKQISEDSDNLITDIPWPGTRESGVSDTALGEWTNKDTYYRDDAHKVILQTRYMWRLSDSSKPYFYRVFSNDKLIDLDYYPRYFSLSKWEAYQRRLEARKRKKHYTPDDYKGSHSNQPEIDWDDVWFYMDDYEW